MNGQIRAIAYGGGVQSAALLVLAAAGRIDFDDIDHGCDDGACFT